MSLFLLVKIRGVAKLHSQISTDGRRVKTKIFLLYNHRSEINSYVSSHLRTQTLLTDIERVVAILKWFC